MNSIFLKFFNFRKIIISLFVIVVFSFGNINVYALKPPPIPSPNSQEVKEEKGFFSKIYSFFFFDDDSDKKKNEEELDINISAEKKINIENAHLPSVDDLGDNISEEVDFSALNLPDLSDDIIENSHDDSNIHSSKNDNEKIIDNSEQLQADLKKIDDAEVKEKKIDFSKSENEEKIDSNLEHELTSISTLDNENNISNFEDTSVNLSENNKNTENPNIQKNQELANKTKNLDQKLDKIKNNDSSKNANAIDDNISIDEKIALLPPEHREFVINETKLLLIPRDDVELGELSDPYSPEIMHYSEFIKNYRKHLYYEMNLANSNKLKNIQTILANNNNSALSYYDVRDEVFSSAEKGDIDKIRAIYDNTHLNFFNMRSSSCENIIEISAKNGNYFLSKYLTIKDPYLRQQDLYGFNPLEMSVIHNLEAHEWLFFQSGYKFQ